LAKLGGMNRKYFDNLTVLDILENCNESLEIYLNFKNSEKKATFHLHPFIELSMKYFYNNKESDNIDSAFSILKYSLLAMMKLDGNIKEFKIPKKIGAFKSSKINLTIVSNNNFFDQYDIEEKDYPPKTIRRTKNESDIFKKLLTNLFISTGNPKIKDKAEKFLNNICRHFALLFISKSKQVLHPLKDINPDVFLDAIVEVFSFENADYENINVEKYLLNFINTMKIMCNDSEIIEQFHIWEKLVVRLSHCCHQREWNKKIGGCRGIIFLCQNLSINWIKQHEQEFGKYKFKITSESITFYCKRLT
jgi:hypothetical protein